MNIFEILGLNSVLDTFIPPAAEDIDYESPLPTRFQDMGYGSVDAVQNLRSIIMLILMISVMIISTKLLRCQQPKRLFL